MNKNAIQRFIALRFMDIKILSATYIRVYSDTSGRFKPQILINAIHKAYARNNGKIVEPIINNLGNC